MSAQEIRKAVAKLERRIEELNAFDPSSLTKRIDIPEVRILEAAIDEALSHAFGHGSVEYGRYSAATKLDQGALQMSSGGHDANNAREGQKYHAEGKVRSLSLLRAAVKSLREELEDMSEDDTATVTACIRSARPA